MGVPGAPARTPRSWNASTTFVASMSDYMVKDLALAEEGRKKLDWAEAHMPVLAELRKEWEQEKPLAGMRIAGCLHVTKETGILIRTLRAAGAELSWSGCNPLSTQDDVAAATLGEGPELLGAVAQGHWRGLVVKALGAGHLPESWVAPLEELARRMPVVLATRVSRGPVKFACWQRCSVRCSTTLKWSATCAVRTGWRSAFTAQY